MGLGLGRAVEKIVDERLYNVWLRVKEEKISSTVKLREAVSLPIGA